MMQLELSVNIKKISNNFFASHICIEKVAKWIKDDSFNVGILNYHQFPYKEAFII